MVNTKIIGTFLTLLVVLLIHGVSGRRSIGRDTINIDLNEALKHESKCDTKMEYPKGHFHCMCNSSCAKYGDCCRESEYFRKDEQLWGVTPYTCKAVTYYDNFYVISSCPPNWDDDSTRKGCENPEENYRDLHFKVPVLSVRSNETYLNVRCALCNRDFNPEDDILWNANLSFETQNFLITLLNETLGTDEVDRLYYDEKRNNWYFNVTDLRNSFKSDDYTYPHIEDDYEIEKIRMRPPSDELLPRSCIRNLIGKCAKDWADVEEKEKCEGYTDIFFYCSDIFRNPHCALCNNVDRNKVFDCKTYGGERGPDLTSFSVLLDWKSKREMKCLETELYDPRSKTCRKLVPKVNDDDAVVIGDENRSEEGVEDKILDFGPTLAKFVSTTVQQSVSDKFNGELEEHSTQKPQLMKNGRNSRIEEDEMEKSPQEIQNKTEKVGAISQTDITSTPNPVLNVTEYDLNGLEIDTLYHAPEGIKEDYTDAYITVVGIGISILCLLLHLVVFLATPKLMNMPAMNLASLCIALLLLYLTFIAGVIVGPPCRVIAVLTHYSLLATFCWMLAISFDVWRAIRRIIRDIYVPSENERRRRFALYSAISWILPALIVIIALMFEFSNTNFTPGYGVTNCWIENPDAVLIFSFVPLCVIMACDVIFFCWSVFLVYTSKSKMAKRSTAQPMDFQLFIKLGLMMGLTWVTGLVAGIVNVKALWYIFILFNTLQGCFIFIAFSCMKKVRSELTQQYASCCCKPPLNASQQT